ncbi:MAG TPA: DUF169 domain-containing protein [Kiritimatiellia bacterium]|nr:DUF169 domain-containing protein [Kiritimatiellia bacterium]HRZ11326.1 DUF169 domain-containing protein [Kiritimatiellia bacterium]HSA17123.1 DUF169 domain-containing protein [Kiritimatiellia bacterium]
MDLNLKQEFAERWARYFPGAELPVAFFYASDPGSVREAAAAAGHRCFIGDLAAVRRGTPLAFRAEALTCGGAQRYLGFTQKLRPNFEYFLSCGIPGQLEGERYKQSPALVTEALKRQPPFQAPGRWLVAKRWDVLEAGDEPFAAVFFAPPDVLAGLFTLANFDETDPDGVRAPFGAGCASIVYWPLQELRAERPRAILGMFDVSARPCVGPNRLTFAVPWPKLVRMARNMEESFLRTESWKKIMGRIRTASAD